MVTVVEIVTKRRKGFVGEKAVARVIEDGDDDE